MVAAAGVPGIITGDMVKPGAAVLDVGVSRVDGKIAGDVADDVWDVAGWVSPNPGGVGPMTRAMLLSNIVTMAEKARPERGPGESIRATGAVPPEPPVDPDEEPTPSVEEIAEETAEEEGRRYPSTIGGLLLPRRARRRRGRHRPGRHVGDWRVGVRWCGRRAASRPRPCAWCCPARTPACSPYATAG